jgi:hypothetical protein
MSTLCGAEMLGRLLNVSDEPDRDLSDVDFTRAAQTALDGRLGARLFAEIQRLGLESRFTPDMLQSLRAQHLRIVLRNRALRRRAVDVLRRFAAEGIAAMAMKGGVALLGQPATMDCMRHMADLDLLVAPEHSQTCHRLLAEMGFVSVCDYDIADMHHGPTLRDRKFGLALEVHTRPVEARWPDFTAAFIAQGESVTLTEDVTVRLPSTRHQILHNMIHAQYSDRGFILGDADLRHLFEFAEKCAHLDAASWSALIDDAAALGLRPHLLSWIYAAHRIFGLKLPPDLRFRASERHQFRHIRNRELLPHSVAAAERVVLYHLFVLDGVFSPRELGTYYRYWAERALQLLQVGQEPRVPEGGWPRGRGYG